MKGGKTARVGLQEGRKAGMPKEEEPGYPRKKKSQCPQRRIARDS
jgi:hypothetical protein